MNKSTARETFCRNLRRLLALDNRPQSDFAKYMNVDNSAVTNWKTGKNAPRIDKMWKIAEWFDVDEAELTQLHTELKEVPKRAVSISSLINDLFADRPDVQELLRKGAYQTEGGILIGKKLDDLSPFAKEHIRNTLLLVLKSDVDEECLSLSPEIRDFLGL